VPLWSLILAGLLGIGVGATAWPGSKSENVSAAASGASTTTLAPTTSLAPTTTTTTTAAAPAPLVVLDTSGATNATTDRFTVDGRWKITAETTGTAGAGFAIIDAATDRPVDLFTVEKSGGESAREGSGTYYLQVTPSGGPYHVVVTDVPG
jgi:hypothetical protein